MSSQGKATVVVADNSSGATLLESEAKKGSVRATGVLTDHRPLTCPAPATAEDSYRLVVHNACAGGKDLILRTKTGARKVRLAPGISSIIEFDENGAKELQGGVYDPRHFGAIFDGETDDLPALDAMVAAMASFNSNPKATIIWPRGTCWLSDRWVINRAVNIVFNNGNLSESAIEVAPGKTGIVLEGSQFPFAQAGGLVRPNLRSSHLIHPTATGNALGLGCKTYSAGAIVRKGECWVKAAGADPTLCFRAIAMRAGAGGRGPATMPGSQPAWSSTVGATTVDSNGTTWRTEKIVSERQNSHSYRVGDRVLTVRSNIYYFECVKAGKSASSAPAQMSGGRTQGTNVLSDYSMKVSRECANAEPYALSNGQTLIVRVDSGVDQTVTFNSGSFVNIGAATAEEVAAVIDAALTDADAAATSGGAKVTITSQNLISVDIVGGTARDSLGFALPTSIADGDVEWAAKVAAGIYLHAVYTVVERPVVVGFMGPGTYAVGGLGYDADLGDGFVDGFMMRGPIDYTYCGMGLFVSGDDGNGWWVDGGVWGTNLGSLLPTPEHGAFARSQTNPGDHGGGHLLHDCSLAGGYMGGLYAQASTGYPVLKNGLGLLTLVSCYSENGYSFHGETGEVTVIGGNLPFSDDSALVVSMNQQKGRGITHVQRSNDAPYVSRDLALMLPSGLNAKLYAFWAQRDAYGISTDPNTWGWYFNNSFTPAHWWALNHGNDTARNAFDLASVGTGLNPGAGWLCFENGHFIGKPGLDTIAFKGHYNSINLNQLRGGQRKRGDRFRDQDEDVVVLEDATDSAATPASAPSYHGHISWSNVPSTVSQFDYPYQGFAGYRVEPTATFGKVGSKVFRVKTGGVLATVECDKAEPYALADGQTLLLRVDTGSYQTVTFSAGSFADIAAATAEEVAAVIASALAGADSSATSGGTKVTITSRTPISIEIKGGTACVALGFQTAIEHGPYIGKMPTKGSSEPDWSSAVNPGDTINDNAGSGNTVWELLGYRPPLSRQSAQTTTNATGQKIAEFPIPAGSTTFLSCVVIGNKSGTDDGFSGQLAASFRRSGTGNILTVGKERRLLDKTAGLAISDTSGSEGVYYKINNTTRRVEVLIDPNEAVTFDLMTRCERNVAAS